jgi:hypothetical protein
VPEGQLAFDPATRRLTISQGSRQDAAVHGAREAVLAVLKAATAPMNKGDVVDACRLQGHPEKQARKAIDAALAAGAIEATTGAKNAKLLSLPGQFGSLAESGNEVAKQKERVSVAVRQTPLGVPNNTHTTRQKKSRRKKAAV